MYKKTKVVMLPTNEKAIGAMYIHNKRMYKSFKTYEMLQIDSVLWKQDRSEPQHLYILSDEEIKKGEYYYDSVEDKITLAISYLENHKGKRFKLIASTDKYVGAFNSKTFPQPTDAFIQKYIEEYNKGNVITEVLVEYAKCSELYCNSSSKELKLKISKDNTITIKKIKDSWTRKELDKITWEIFNVGYDAAFKDEHPSDIYNYWKQENL